MGQIPSRQVSILPDIQQEPEISTQLSQEPATGSCPKPDE